MSAVPISHELIPPSWGRCLCESDYPTLAASWITPEIADAAMPRRVEDYEGREIVGQKNRNCAGFDLFLEFAVEAGAVDSAERDELTSRCWSALSCAAAAQAKHQVATGPTARFLTLLRSLFASERAHLEARGGGAPERSPGSCGWRCDTGNWIPRDDCIGWTDGDDIYLEPTAAFRVVQIAGRDIGEFLAVSEQTLRKRLHEKRLLASVDEARQTLTVRRGICGSSKSVLHFRRSTILPGVSDADEDAE